MTENQRQWLKAGIGIEVLIDSSGNQGKITSLSVTSDGFVIGQTSPGYDRGVFLGRLPSDEVCKEFLTRQRITRAREDDDEKRGVSELQRSI